MKVKSILVSQPEPQTENSPYFDLANKYKLKVDFIPFIHVAGVDVAEVRKQKINLANHTAVILTSRNAVDHFFRIAEEMRYTVPNDLKYFCTSEAIAYYLQKYVVYRKRKIYFGQSKFQDLVPLFKKHKTEKYLLPTSDILKPQVPETLAECGVDYTRAVLYNTVSSDLSHLADVKYDILVFFSPSGIKSLFENFPDFEQGNTRIAGFGNTTHKAIEEAGLTVNIKAPSPKLPSMTMAIEHYIKEMNKK
ncbi:uroporphyrinogen-III synthase [Croceimicrobium hydrocarbonivorans]|uniref:Uroporphyrinogen-III synthase n=1 Tax=Croceimicrobium hydrocarbonivorans TaxID=2761580 RepID=A0A7H0VAP6_9FLAO|nr:uroporphyrinogen-III synthase [Croceimicrobium hydrocarbonivorans]QNR22794.1 uroporphyrinogen-III synthase [Croceimicrobium hydrocarbonivorans]